MRTYSNNLSNAPYSTCPECGWSGRDWGFKYSNLCKRCHAKSRKKKAVEIRKHNEEIRQLLEYIKTNAEIRIHEENCTCPYQLEINADD